MFFGPIFYATAHTCPCSHDRKISCYGNSQFNMKEMVTWTELPLWPQVKLSKKIEDSPLLSSPHLSEQTSIHTCVSLYPHWWYNHILQNWWHWLMSNSTHQIRTIPWRKWKRRCANCYLRSSYQLLQWRLEIFIKLLCAILQTIMETIMKCGTSFKSA